MSGRMLAALAPELTADLAAAGLGLALQLRSDFSSAEVFEALIPNLDEDQLAAVVSSLRYLGPWKRQVCSVLAPHLRTGMLGRVLRIAVGRKPDLDAAKCLEALAPHLPDDLLDRAVRVAARTTNGFARRTALEGLAPHLHGTHAKAAFKAALTITGDPATRAMAAAAVAPMLANQDRDQALAAALEAALAVDALWARANALARLVPFLTGDAKSTALEQGLQAAMSLRNRRGYIQPTTPLTALVPELDGEALRTALLGLLSVEDTDERARAFKECHLPTQGPGLATAQLVLADQLLASRTLHRADLLRTLTLPVFTPPFLPSGEIETIARTTVEICWHWSWQ